MIFRQESGLLEKYYLFNETQVDGRKQDVSTYVYRRRGVKIRCTMDEILGTKINIKFWKSKLGLEIKCNAQWIYK